MPFGRFIPFGVRAEGGESGERSYAAHGGEVDRFICSVAWPQGVGTRPEMEQGKGGTAPGDFALDCAELAELLGEFVNQPEFGVPHPIFGRMTREQWLRWGYLHMDHHLRQFGV